MNARAFVQRGRWYTDGPDVADVPCARCQHLVESVDARGRCDDCASDRLVVALDEISTFDVDVALALGRLSFAIRTAPRPYLTPCALCNAPTAPDELDHVDGLAGAHAPVCLGCLGELDAWAAERRAADLDAAADRPGPVACPAPHHRAA